MSETKGDKRLRRWFTIHFAADVAVAVPLMIAPRWLLATLGWQTIDPVAARLVAAALFGIGIESLLGRDAPAAAIKAMLNLKIIWSAAAVIALALALVENSQGRPWSLWIILAIFLGFNAVWVLFRLHLHDTRTIPNKTTQ